MTCFRALLLSLSLSPVSLGWGSPVEASTPTPSPVLPTPDTSKYPPQVAKLVAEDDPVDCDRVAWNIRNQADLDSRSSALRPAPTGAASPSHTVAD